MNGNTYVNLGNWFQHCHRRWPADAGRYTRAVGKRRAVWVAIGDIAMYTLLVGANAAVVRAAIMGGLFVLALCLRRQAEVSNHVYRFAVHDARVDVDHGDGASRLTIICAA